MILYLLHHPLHYPLQYAPNSAELEHVCFWIKNKRHHANNVARCLFGALEVTRTPDLLIRSQNFLMIFNENALNCYSIVAL